MQKKTIERLEQLFPEEERGEAIAALEKTSSVERRKILKILLEPTDFGERQVLEEALPIEYAAKRLVDPLFKIFEDLRRDAVV